ncbi:MAG: hypothetical protein ABIH23_18975 [bacterium]
MAKNYLVLTEVEGRDGTRKWGPFTTRSDAEVCVQALAVNALSPRVISAVIVYTDLEAYYDKKQT